MSFMPYVANVIGILLMLLLLISNRMSMKAKRFEYILIESIIIIVLLGCLCEMMADMFDGKRFVDVVKTLYFLNTVSFLANDALAFVWFMFADYQLWQNKKRLWTRNLKLCFPLVLIFVFLLTNPLHHLAFSINPMTRMYERGPFFNSLVMIEGLYFFFSIANVHRSKRQLGSYIYFPICIYLLPILIGSSVQAMYYGLLTGWASTAIAITGVFISMQHNMAFQDTLTGLYNRNYLNFLFDGIDRDIKHTYGGIMLDLDDFKKINDNLGHLAGDEAIKEAGKIIRSSISPECIAIRYAGDEFVVIIQNATSTKLNAIMENIKTNSDLFNANPSKRYTLKFSMGSSMYIADETDQDEFLRQMDENMYKDKMAHKAGR